MSHPRRRVLQAFSAGVATLVAGCGRRTYSNSTPEAFSIEVWNDLGEPITADVTLLDNDRTAWEGTFDIAVGRTAQRDVDLTGRSYTVQVRLDAATQSGATRFEEEWIWGACNEATVAIGIQDDGLTVDDTCRQ